jgi:choline dehydrogenase-like flavoprotein
MTDVFTAESPAVVDTIAGDRVACDIAIIGSGMAGGTAALTLRNSGARVLIIERGDFLPREAANWSPTAVFREKRYKNAEPWFEGRTGKPFLPGVHYWVGGNTKVYGACLPRFREQDFGEIRHPDGISPAWPFSYADIEPFYGQAERIYGVHGDSRGDPTAPWRSADPPYPALEHEPDLAALSDALSQQGLHPFVMPMGVDIRDGGRCIRCRTCDGYPCRLGAKNDAEVCAIRPSLESSDTRLLTRALVTRLETTPDGEAIREAVLIRDGREILVSADRFILAGGAANSAALLLRSVAPSHPDGLANSSGLVGTNYMVHASTFFVAVDPRRQNNVFFQKTLGLNDWYLGGADTEWPLGNVQMLGKLQGTMFKAARPRFPMPALDYVARHSIDLYLTTEDVPKPENRVRIGRDGHIYVDWTPNNLASHAELVRRVTRVMRRAGYPLVFTERMGIDTNSHMCGTAVMGEDPKRSVLDPTCRAHDIANLWVLDSSGFLSSAGVNPALTIAANVLRVLAGGQLER